MIEKTLGWVWREDKQNKKQTIKKMRQNCLLCYHIPALIIHSRQIFIIQKGRWISIVISSWLDSFRLINEDDMTRCLLGRISDRKLNWWQEAVWLPKRCLLVALIWPDGLKSPAERRPCGLWSKWCCRDSGKLMAEYRQLLWDTPTCQSLPTDVFDLGFSSDVQQNRRRRPKRPPWPSQDEVSDWRA